MYWRPRLHAVLLICASIAGARARSVFPDLNGNSARRATSQAALAGAAAPSFLATTPTTPSRSRAVAEHQQVSRIGRTAGQPSQEPDLLNENRAWPKLGKLPLPVLLEGAEALASQKYSQEPSSGGPHIVVNQPTPPVNRLQLAVVYLTDWLHVFGIVCGTFLLLTIFAWLYQKRREGLAGAASGAPIAVQETFKDWTAGPFGCMNAPETCLWGFFCCPIRWADTISISGMLGFWLAFATYTLLWAVGLVTGEVLVWIALALLGTGYRQEIRKKFGMEHGGKTIYQDCLLYTFCPCCLVVQEAQHVDEALRVGHPVIVKEGVQ